MREDILVTKDGKVFIRGEPAKLKLNNSGYLRVTYKKRRTVFSTSTGCIKVCS